MRLRPMVALFFTAMLHLLHCAAAVPHLQPHEPTLLAPQAFVPLPVGSITPRGWLLAQLKLQAEGLSGHLAMFYPSIANSWWVGGSDDQDGWIYQQAPYWLNGFLPLAYQLKNAGIEELHPPKCGAQQHPHEHSGQHDHGAPPPPPGPHPGAPVGPVKPLEQVKTYIDGIVARVQPDGWCGPPPKAAETPKGKTGPPTTTCRKEWNLFGGDLGPSVVLPGGNASTCEARCRADNACAAYVYEQCGGTNHCWKKAGPWQAEKFKGTECVLCSQVLRDLPFPAAKKKGNGDQYWGPTNAMLSLIAYAEAERASEEVYKNVTNVVLRHFLAQKKMMVDTPMSSWAAERWTDMALGVAWLLDHGIGTAAQQADLFELGHTLHQQGTDWEDGFHNNFTGYTGGERHNVNVAQAIKSSGVWYRFSGNSSMKQLSLERMRNLDGQFGLPTGMFNGDELLPLPPTRNPSRGIETCGVVEAMFSWTCLGATVGDARFFDRAERISFNALPAAWASPRGGDMWAHPYLQAVNLVQATKQDPHTWTHDGDMSETFGLEPNFGCCTANFNQGWPKLINQVVMSTADKKGAVVALLVPATATLPDGSTVTINTSYPFEDAVTVTCVSKVAAFSLYIRVPGWATKATINGKPVAAGTFAEESCSGASSSFKLELAPEIIVEEWAADTHGGVARHPGYSVVRGPLLYSLPIEHNYTTYGTHFDAATFGSSDDYYLQPTDSDWNYALDIDPKEPSKTLTFAAGEAYVDGAAPFNRTGPLSITAKARLLPKATWGMELNSAAPPPQSPACSAPVGCGPTTEIQLVPHGYTELRIGEFPLA